jgi:CheY-like chemotaxis protein
MKSAPLRCDARNRVLIVEDNRVSAMVLTRHFGAAGFKESVIDVVASGLEAVKQVRTSLLLFPPSVSLFFSLEKQARTRLGVYRLVVMDVCLQGEMDGLDATREIRQFDPETPILIVSAVQDPSWSARARAAGANGLFAKPITLPAVFAMLEDHSEKDNPRSRRVSDPVIFGFGASNDLDDLMSERDCSEIEMGQSFHLAIWKGEIDVVRFFLGKWLQLIDWLDPTTGNGALHLAARSGNVIMLELLLGAGADPNQCSQKGYNAMHVAAWSGFLSCVEVLEEKGCAIFHKVRGIYIFMLLVSQTFLSSLCVGLMSLTWPVWRLSHTLQRRASFSMCPLSLRGRKRGA